MSEHDKDRRQRQQHFLHWGVKSLIGLGVAAVCGLGWLAWVVLFAHGPR